MAMSRIGRRRLECYELIKKLQSCPGIGATMQYELAMSAVTSAQLVGDRFLEAEAMMLFAHRLAPTYCPKETLEFLKKAESIFLVHKNLHKCMSARALVAFTLCELGEESNAITLAQEILLQGVSLRPDDACIACLAMATAYTKLGDLGRADKFINEAVKYSRAPNASRSSLLTGRIAWVRLQILWEKYIITEHPRLWRGVPFFLSVPEMDSSPPDRNTLAGQISAAREVQPDAKHWNSAQVMELALYGLTGGVEDSGRAVAKLEDLSARLWSLDRPVAVSALLYGAMLFADHGKAGPALEILKTDTSAGSRIQVRDGVARIHPVHLADPGANRRQRGRAERAEAAEARQNQEPHGGSADVSQFFGFHAQVLARQSGKLQRDGQKELRAGVREAGLGFHREKHQKPVAGQMHRRALQGQPPHAGDGLQGVPVVLDCGARAHHEAAGRGLRIAANHLHHPGCFKILWLFLGGQVFTRFPGLLRGSRHPSGSGSNPS